ncbi:hypothetical protein [Taibaiella koreensis]|uniref:hypothetical protein n=1 Tax=Taibaiella koreensis TaxID=1268548 RepID=UPI0013C31735|nr:hypothetical protein [Taibaiella koreensis]
MKRSVCCLLVLLRCTINAFAQESDIHSQEIPLVTIEAHAGKKQEMSSFNLLRYGSRMGSMLLCTEQLGILVPQRVDSVLYLHSAVIPFEYVKEALALTGTSRPEYDFFLLLPFPSGDSFIRLDPEYIVEKGRATWYGTVRRRLILDIGERLLLKEAIPYFYFFMKPRCAGEASSREIFRFVHRFRSKLTYQKINDKVLLWDLRQRDVAFLRSAFFLNWQLKLDYRCDL